jgi:hypothetical protein
MQAQNPLTYEIIICLLVGLLPILAVIWFCFVTIRFRAEALRHDRYERALQRVQAMYMRMQSQRRDRPWSEAISDLERYEESQFLQRENWGWTYSPEIALGKGMLTEEELAKLRAGSLAQSELAVGLMLPLYLFALALSVRAEVGVAPACVVSLILSAAEIGLLFVGVHMKERYYQEVQCLSLGHWERKLTERTRN